MAGKIMHKPVDKMGKKPDGDAALADAARL